MTDVVEIVNQIKRLLEEGHEIYLGDMRIERIEIRPTKKSFIIVVNEIFTYYPSDFIKRKIRVVRSQGGHERGHERQN